ncbi:hypothetical protein ACLBKU_02235 [Erythrobacter sp. NE805]|uniref:hypothetical protein n=1 Tax=Erythrobacter sp. NE805 TaxID=3389875 RepID=UPI00396B184B
MTVSRGWNDTVRGTYWPFAADGVRVLTGHTAARIEDRVLVATRAGDAVRILFDTLIVAVGRKA